VRVAVVRGAMIDTMRKLAQQYQTANPGVTVQVEEEPEGGAFEALIAAGNQPDLITVSFGSQIGRLAATQAVVPLEDMDGAKEILASVDKVTAEQLYGHNYYIPLGADVTLMIYNKELFKEAGLDPEKAPQTWDEFLSAAEKIQGLPAREGGNQTYGTVFWNDALTWGGWYWNMLQPIYLNANQNQCQLLNRLGTDIVFDDPKCALDKFFDFTAKAQKFGPPTMEKNFFGRSIGMWPQYGYSWEPNLKEALGQPMVVGQDVGVAPVPVQAAGDKSFTTYGGRAMMIMKTTPERQNNAWSFVKFLMQPENNMVFLKELGYLPTLTSLKTDPYFQEPARKPFVDALQTAVLPQQFVAAEDVANSILAVYQQAVVQGTIKPPEAVKTAAEQARAALKKSAAQ
jgi:multiple sugar transport system substrate-binding protein